MKNRLIWSRKIIGKMSFRCIFCKEVKDDIQKSPDHIIPETLGSNATINEVCKDCNTGILAKIDAKLVNFWLLKGERVIRGIKTKKGKLPTLDFGKSKLKDSQINARYIVNQQTQDLKVWAKRQEGDTVHLTFSAEDFLKTDFEKLKKRYEKQGIKGISVEIITYKDPKKYDIISKQVKQKLSSLSPQIKIVDKGDFHPTIETKFVFSVYDFQQAIVKIAFEYAILKLGNHYAFSDDSEILRSFILEEDLERRKNIPLKGRIFPSFAPEDPLHNLYRIDKGFHALIRFANSVWIYLFGKLWGIIYIFDINSTDTIKEWLDENSASILLVNSQTKKHQEMNLWKYLYNLNENLKPNKKT